MPNFKLGVGSSRFRETEGMAYQGITSIPDRDHWSKGRVTPQPPFRTRWLSGPIQERW